MTEIVLDVPDDLPLPGLIDRLNNIIAEEHLKWTLFTKSVDVIALDDKDMTALEGMRDETWNMEREEEALRFVIDTNILIGALVKDNSFLSPTFKRS